MCTYLVEKPRHRQGNNNKQQTQKKNTWVIKDKSDGLIYWDPMGVEIGFYRWIVWVGYHRKTKKYKVTRSDIIERGSRSS